MELVVADTGTPPPVADVVEPGWLAPGEYVVVPVHEVPIGPETLLELRPLTDGRRALPVYSSIGLLVGCCGDAQPYGVFRADQIEDLLDASGADVVGVDLPVPVELRRTAP